ncbi:Rho-related protein RAC [Acrasis kona]|uniref:Rho-related protein RAC n=1 Tax=Acrasis kona TaxID=1008807 RepID=A0AAW2YIW1_9EUKA
MNIKDIEKRSSQNIINRLKSNKSCRDSTSSIDEENTSFEHELRPSNSEELIVTKQTGLYCTSNLQHILDHEGRRSDNSNNRKKTNISKILTRKRPNSTFTIQHCPSSTQVETIEKNIIKEKSPTPQRITIHGQRLSRFYIPSSENIHSYSDKSFRFIVQLPEEVLLEIFSFANPQTLGKVLLTCKRWNHLCDTDELWRRFYYFYYNGLINPATNQMPNHRQMFLDLYTADLNLTKTGIWRNSKAARGARRNFQLAREDYAFVKEQVSYENKTTTRNNSMPIKVVVVGDGAVGKTSLLCRFSENYFPERDYLPTIFDNFSTQTIFNNTTYNVSLYDTAGPEDFDKLRPLSYIGCDVFLLCVDLSYSDGLSNVLTRWNRELTRCAPGVPVVMCGTKMDLRVRNPNRTNNNRFTTFDQGKNAAQIIGAVAYAETSALTGDGVTSTFEEVIRIGCLYAGLHRGSSLNINDKKCGIM